MPQNSAPFDKVLANAILLLVAIGSAVAGLIFGSVAALSIATWQWRDQTQVLSPFITVGSAYLWSYLQDYFESGEEAGSSPSKSFDLLTAGALVSTIIGLYILLGLVVLVLSAGIPKDQDPVHIALRGLACLVGGSVLLWRRW